MGNANVVFWGKCVLKRMNVTLGDPYAPLEINHSDTLTTPLIRQGPSSTHSGPAHSLFGPRVPGGMDEGSGGGVRRRRTLGDSPSLTWGTSHFLEGGDGHQHYIHMCQDLGGFSYSCDRNDTINPRYGNGTRVLKFPSKMTLESVLVMLEWPVNGWYYQCTQ